MANHTPNYNLSTPEATDTQASFIADYVTNMGIIDSNLGGGGGGGFVETTTASYEALPDEQKLDPNKLYMLNDTPPTDIPVDFDDCVNKKASRMSVSVVGGALVWTYSGVGGQVSANSFYPTAIPKEAEKLVINLSTGTAYNASTFEIGIGVRATYQDTSYVYSNDQSWLAIATYNQINQSNVELEVDLSSVTDDSYLVIACFGWNVTFDSIVVKFGGTPQYQTSIRYKDIPYADGQGGGDTVAWTQIQQSGTKIAEIEISGVTTDVYAPQGAPPFSALIIVTADTGKTVTATKGGDTYTATEVSTGQYEVTVDSIGTWTISDGTLSDTVTVTSSTTYYVTLSAIPDGSTVLPTDDIQIWLNCADIWDKAYTTLNEVLSDTVTLTALIADNNAVDYMVRSTTWASGVCADSTAMSYIGLNNYASNTLLADATWCNAICNSTYFESVLNAKVPTMTSLNTPEGEVTYHTCYNLSVYAPWMAFDNNASTKYTPANTDSFGQAYIGYKFTSSVKIVKCLCVQSQNGIGTVHISASNDSFATSDTLISNVDVSNNNTTFNWVNANGYTECRMYIDAFKTGVSQFASIELSTLQFYGRKDV